MVAYEVRRGLTAIAGHSWSVRLLYFAAVHWSFRLRRGSIGALLSMSVDGADEFCNSATEPQE